MYRGSCSVLEYPAAMGKTKLMLMEWHKMNENAMSCLRPGTELQTVLTSEVVAVAVNHKKEECSRKKMAVPANCICSFSCPGCPGW